MHAALGPYIHAYHMCRWCSARPAPRLLTRFLSGDVDRSVRAAASHVMLLLIQRCGRAIAPHLKVYLALRPAVLVPHPLAQRLCAPLFMARCDPALAAKQVCRSLTCRVNSSRMLTF